MTNMERAQKKRIQEDPPPSNGRGKTRGGREFSAKTVHTWDKGVNGKGGESRPNKEKKKRVHRDANTQRDHS